MIWRILYGPCGICHTQRADRKIDSSSDDVSNLWLNECITQTLSRARYIVRNETFLRAFYRLANTMKNFINKVGHWYASSWHLEISRRNRQNFCFIKSFYCYFIDRNLFDSYHRTHYQSAVVISHGVIRTSSHVKIHSQKTLSNEQINCMPHNFSRNLAIKESVVGQTQLTWVIAR